MQVPACSFRNLVSPPTVPSKSSRTKERNFTFMSLIKLPLQTIWIDDQAPRNVGPDRQSILFDNKVQFLKKNLTVKHALSLVHK